MKEGKLIFCRQSNREYEYIYRCSIQKLNLKHSLLWQQGLMLCNGGQGEVLTILSPWKKEGCC